MTATSTYLCIPAATAVVVTGHACVRGMQRQYSIHTYTVFCVALQMQRRGTIVICNGDYLLKKNAKLLFFCSYIEKEIGYDFSFQTHNEYFFFVRLLDHFMYFFVIEKLDFI